MTEQNCSTQMDLYQSGIIHKAISNLRYGGEFIWYCKWTLLSVCLSSAHNNKFPWTYQSTSVGYSSKKIFLCEFDALIFTPSTFHRLAPSVILWAMVYSIDRGNRDNNNNNITQKNRQYSNYNMCPVRLKCINQTCLSYP